jgi:hypothetical protein
LASDVAKEKLAHAKKRISKASPSWFSHVVREGQIDELERARELLAAPNEVERVFWQRVLEEALNRIESMCVIAQATKERRSPEPYAWDLCLPVSVEIGPRVFYEDSGAVRVVVTARACCYDFDRELSPEAHAWAVSAPVYYQLSVDWAESQKWPRYEVVCHAPSCRRHFYSARPEAKRCPGSLRCRREWMDYQNWLKKMRKSPAKDWNNEHLRKIFSSQYRPRKT